MLINTILPELHLVGLLYIIEDSGVTLRRQEKPAAFLHALEAAALVEQVSKFPTHRNTLSTNNKGSKAAHIMKTSLKVAAEYAAFQAPHQYSLGFISRLTKRFHYFHLKSWS